jgi:hypothetical protein
MPAPGILTHLDNSEARMHHGFPGVNHLLIRTVMLYDIHPDWHFFPQFDYTWLPRIYLTSIPWGCENTIQ